MHNSQPFSALSIPPVPQETADVRLEQLSAWIAATLPNRPFSLAPASADASFRRYFRASFADGQTLVAMDAPPAKEDCRPFIHAASEMAKSGVRVPTVLQADLAQGFLLLDDFGSTTYLAALTPAPGATPNFAAADALYRDALRALVDLQKGTDTNAFAPYDTKRLTDEMALFPTWYIEKHLGVTLTPAMQATLGKALQRLTESALAQPQVVVHRDYHSRNLMVLPQGNPGILDFQDAVTGPVTYDLVSLLRDAYIEWEEPQVLDWAIRYWEMARKAGLEIAPEFGDFYQQFEWMGLQRHLKILGIFARLYHRDGKDGYLKDLPLVMRYTRKVCQRYAVFGELLRLLDGLEGIEAKTGYTF